MTSKYKDMEAAPSIKKHSYFASTNTDDPEKIWGVFGRSIDDKLTVRNSL